MNIQLPARKLLSDFGIGNNFKQNSHVTLTFDLTAAKTRGHHPEPWATCVILNGIMDKPTDNVKPLCPPLLRR